MHATPHTPQQRHQRLTDLFQRASDLPAASRDEFLSRECGNDPELRFEVSRLLGQDSEALLPSQDTAISVRRERLFAAIDDPSIQPTIRGFHILQVLGRGGMGVVYLAEQERPRRQVALKVLRAGSTTARMLRRFENEAEVLARLQHPGIAQVYETGTFTPVGAGAEAQPYFAMEVVRGKPITEYAMQVGLSVSERLALMVKVCDALQHAHAKGVIHRDLKPGNILVNDAGEPKVLDFGVAKLMQSNEAPLTIDTVAGQVIGTPQYMSPEQAGGDLRDLDTRSDVYSLGLILYEVVAGVRPYDVPVTSLFEAMNTVRRAEPRRLRDVDRALGGDIEVVVGKALKKDRAARYQSALDLGADLRRLIEGKPVHARPPSVAYVFKKFAQRNRALTAVGMAAVLLGLVGVVGGTIAFLQWRRSDTAVKRLTSVQTYWNGVLGGTDLVSSDMKVSVHGLLDRAAQEAQAAFGDDENTMADQRLTLGQAYAAIGSNKKAVEQLAFAHEIRSRLFGPHSDPALTVLEEIGRVKSEYIWAIDTERPRFLSEMDELVAARTAGWGPDDPKTLRATAILARAEGINRSGRLASSHHRFEQVLPKIKKSFGADHVTTLKAQRDYVETLDREARYGDAIALLDQMIAVERIKYGEASAEVIDSLIKLGAMTRGQGRLHESAVTLQTAVALAEANLGQDNFLRWEAHHQLGRVLTDLGDTDAAERELRPAYLNSRVWFYERYGNMLEAIVENDELRGEWGDARDLENVFWREHVTAWEHYPNYRAAHLAKRSRYSLELGDVVRAKELLTEADDAMRSATGFKSGDGTARALLLLAHARLDVLEGRSDSAADSLREAFNQVANKSWYHNVSEDRRIGRRILGWLIELETGRDHPEDAERWRRVARRWESRELLGRTLMRATEDDVAKEYLVPRFDEHRQFFGDSDPRTIDVARTLIELYQKMGKPTAAIPYIAFLAEIRESPFDDLME